MQRLYTEVNGYGLERQKSLIGERRRERIYLGDGAALNLGRWFHRASEWLVDHLAFIGKNLPCIDNDLACDMQFVG